VAVASDIQGEEYYQIAIGQGMYTSELATNIPDGYSAICYNMVATGDSLENRIGIRRPNVDWKVLETNPGYLQSDSDNYNFFCELFPWENDSSKPAFAWGARGLAIPGGAANGNTLNLVRADGVKDAFSSFISVAMTAPVLGICQYNQVIYVSVQGAGVKKITAINWQTGAVTFVDIASSGTSTLRGLFTFKDRLWGWGSGTSGHKLYFTDLPAVGGQPETWAFAANVVPFVSPTGHGRIEQIVPLGNKLGVFTTNGFFTLLVEGAPGSWILRMLDSKSVSTSSQCAFESKGIIYYVNTQGVWATNNLTTTKVSMVIDDQWFLSKGARVHTLVPYEDGMLVSIAKTKVTTTLADSRFFDKANCRIFYSQQDPVAWSEWNVNSYGLGTYPEKYAMFWSTTSKIPTYLNSDPTVYAMLFVTDSTQAGSSTYAVAQLCIFDGGSDVYVNRTNVVQSQPVGLYLKTKHFDGGNQYAIKRAKRGLLEVYSSDSDMTFDTSWDIDSTTSVATEVRDETIDDFTVGLGSNLVQISNQFRYRRASFNLRVLLKDDNHQFKIKDMAIAQDTGRAEFELVR
jgi:hypothetical protein